MNRGHWFWLLLGSLLSFSHLQGQSGFTEVAISAGIEQKVFSWAAMAGGSAWFDYDRDGDEDLYTSGGWIGNKLWRNEGNGTFTDVTQAAGLILPDSITTQGVVTGDIDNDGYREIYLSTWWNEQNYLFHNQGNGTFIDISLSSGLGVDSGWVSSAAFADFDRDGLLDLYTANYVRETGTLSDSMGNDTGYSHRCDGNQLWHNNGDGTFTDIAATYALGDTGCALAVIFTDYDGDRDQDIWVANDFGAWVAPNVLYQNDLPSGFNDVSQAAGVDAGIYGMGFAVGDYDHDLDLDYYITNIGHNLLHQNMGNGTFLEVSDAAGVPGDSVSQAMSTGWGTFFLDVDNDSWDDLFCANGYIALLPLFTNAVFDPDNLWRNNGNGTFSDVGYSMDLGDSSRARGASFCDYDQDGDLDIFVSCITPDTVNRPDRSLLFRNDLAGTGHWFQARLEGVVSNRDAYGAQIVIAANGTQWVHEVNGGSSHMSQNTSIAHFGLGTATVVDTLHIFWPSGIEQILTNLPADTLMTIVEDTNLVNREEALPLAVQAYPNPFSASVAIEVSGIGTGLVEYEIMDVMGRLVYRDRAVSGTPFTWQGRDQSGRLATQGVYWLRVRAEGREAVVKLVRQ